MAQNDPFTTHITPDWEALVRCIRREGTPARVHHIELFLDPEVQDAVCERFNLSEGLDSGDPYYAQKRLIALQRFLGYDYVRCGLQDFVMPMRRTSIEDTAGLQRESGRSFIEEHRGPIANWAEFEAYPWPDPWAASTRSLQWYEANLPDDMCVIGSGGYCLGTGNSVANYIPLDNYLAMLDEGRQFSL